MSDVKKFMYLNRRAPYGTIYAWESLEVVLIGAAFDQEVSLMFVDDGVYQLVKGSKPADIDMKNFTPTYRTLDADGPDHAKEVEVAAVILLLAIVAAITLTMRRRPGLKVQDIAKQVAVRAKDRIRVVKMDAEKKQ